MKLFGEMVEETQAYLRSFVRDQEMSTHLTADITFSGKELPVDDPTVLTRGRVEIGEELVWIDRSDRANAVGVIPPYGRGMDGTVPSAHTSGDRVIVQPLYPRKLLKDTLNQSISAAGLQLYGVEVISLTPSQTSFLYELPAYTREVLNVKVSETRLTVANSDVVFLRDWTFDRHSPSTISSTGKGLYLYDGRISPTCVITVTIARDPSTLWFDSQLFTESYLPETCWDVIVLSAAARLLATADSYDIQTRSVEANSLDSKIIPGAAAAQSKYLYQLSQQRLAEERTRLLNSTIQRTHYSRR